MEQRARCRPAGQVIALEMDIPEGVSVPVSRHPAAGAGCAERFDQALGP
jgi:hypothetical protein